MEQINQWFQTFDFWIKLGGWTHIDMKDGRPSTMRKLSMLQVQAIRASKLPYKDLSEIFKVPPSSISAIKRYTHYLN